MADRFLKSQGDLRARAWALFRDGKLQQAIDLLERLRKLRPEEKDLQTQIEHVLFHLTVWGSPWDSRRMVGPTRLWPFSGS